MTEDIEGTKDGLKANIFRRNINKIRVHTMISRLRCWKKRDGKGDDNESSSVYQHNLRYKNDIRIWGVRREPLKLGDTII